MSTTRSQKRKNAQLSADDDVSEGFISPAEVENSSLVEQDSSVAGPSKSKSPRVENSFLESLRASLKEEITSEIRNLLAESQREMLKLLKPETRENVRINIDDETENETRSFYTPTKSVRITSTQNNDTNSSRNMVTGVLNDSTNQVKRPKIRSQSQPAPKERPAVARTLFGAEKIHKLCIELEYDPMCQINAYLTLQYGQTNTYRIQTSKFHTMNGMQYHGKWISENKSMNKSH